jgi:hypothetical protein
VARYSDDFRDPVIPRPWVRAAIWQHSNGRLGPVKGVPGLGRVDVNALHPDLPLSALRLRPAGRPARPAGGRPRPRVVVPEPPATGGVVPVPRDAPPVEVLVPTIAPHVTTPTVTTPTVTTTTTGGAADQPGTIVITVTVPLPATPAPVVVFPDLGPLQEQLTIAARGIQGAIEALPERQEP